MVGGDRGGDGSFWYFGVVFVGRDVHSLGFTFDSLERVNLRFLMQWILFNPVDSNSNPVESRLTPMWSHTI